MWKFGTLTVSPFSWLEASYFYYRPEDLRWEANNIAGDYLDKGFNVKFIYNSKNQYVPNLALGIDDFAGTGFFTREYLVSTSHFNNTKFSLGIGWGKFVGEKSFKNPFSIISDRFLDRSIRSSNFDKGGRLSYDQWFRGESTLFGGLEHKFPNLNGLKLKLEYDPFDYIDFSANNRIDASRSLRDKTSNINIGISYPINDFVTVDLSYIKGNSINLNFNISARFDDKLYSKPKFKPQVTKELNDKKATKKIFYKELLNNLNKNGLLLQTANLDGDGRLAVSVSTSSHRNAIRSSSYISSISYDVAKLNNVELTSIEVSHLNAGVELNKIMYIANHFDKEIYTPIEVKKYYTSMGSVAPDNYRGHEYQPKVLFPAVFSSLTPSLVTHIGNPDKFYYGGLNIQHISEIQFSRNLMLSSKIEYPVYSNIDEAESRPVSNMVHVRTDLLDYLKYDELHITKMQLDYVWSPYKNFYAKVSGGLYESMFGGYGAEFLYKPFNKNFTIGMELFNVKQRSAKKRFKFRDYKTTTGHLDFVYYLGMGIEANLSFGRYLAKDDGYTFDLSRKTNSGFRAGVYFTRTNVSAELFGEGSFDKGFYFQIPLDILSNSYRGDYFNFKLSPLSRDGGAKLIHENSLRGLIHNSNYNELSNQWNGFLN
jgi:hypothetical protein